MDTILQLNGAVGRGQENGEDDVSAIDNALREIGAYSPPPEYAHEPQRYTTEPMVDALEKFQEQNGLKIDGYAKPGGPTERAINNNLLGKPRGAGLLRDFALAVGDTVGNGFANAPRDVAKVKLALGGLGYLPEDPFDRPSGFIEESTTKAIQRFQSDNHLTADGWLAPGGETDAALRQAVDRLARVKRPEWLEYHRRAPAPGALQGVGYLDDPAAATRAFRKLFGAASDRSKTDEWLRPLQDAAVGQPSEPAAPPSQGVGSVAGDPESNFGSWAMKRSGVLPEGVTPPDDPLVPDRPPRDMPNEMPSHDADGRMQPVDVGTSSRREMRRLITRIYRVGGRGEDGTHSLGDRDFDSYLAAAKLFIKPQHFGVFELTARAVRAGVLDSQTAATRLADYYAPATTGETILDVLLDFAPGVSNAKAAVEAAEALERARDAAAYGDEAAYNAAIGGAALAIGALIIPGAGAGAKRLLAKAIGEELHHLIPRYLGGTRNGPHLPLTPEEHRQAANSIHQLMQTFFAERFPKLVHSWKNPGAVIVFQVGKDKRFAALDAFYRSLEKSELAHLRGTYEAWLKIFPEAKKYLR